MVEQLAYIQRVTGSIPVIPIAVWHTATSTPFFIFIRDVKSNPVFFGGLTVIGGKTPGSCHLSGNSW